jgi:hypothetical protein
MSAETLLAGHAGVVCKIRGSSADEDHHLRPVRSLGVKRWRSCAGDIKKHAYFSAAELPTSTPPTLRPPKGHELGTHRDVETRAGALALRGEGSVSLWRTEGTKGVLIGSEASQFRRGMQSALV